MSSVLSSCIKCNERQTFRKDMTCRHCLPKRTRTKRSKIPRVCAVCKKDFVVSYDTVKRGGGFTCSRACFHIRYRTLDTPRRIQNKNLSPERLARYKYEVLHAWVRRNLGTPHKCQLCGTTEGWFDWSNISGEYKQDLSDWQRLCRKCHAAYDNRGEKVKAAHQRKRVIMNI